MQYPYPNYNVSTPQGYISLDANVQAAVNAINANAVLPYGDYGGPNIYYFQTMKNGLGNIIYTVFDKSTKLGLQSFMVRFGAATIIRQVILGQFPKSEIELQLLVLPDIPIQEPQQGSVTP